ncbi:MAG: TetR/AcrR family transcriptional regulator [Bacteroidota bacterium]
MAITDTKQKILDASLLLFNENGISNVRLQQIADGTGISVGNLAYHFSNKEAITESLIANVIGALQDLLRQYGKYESLNDMDFFFREFYGLCNKYRFFNCDILEIKRNFRPSYDLLNPLFNKVKLQLERRFDICLQQRLLQKETNIKSITSNTWFLMFFMPVDGQMNGKAPITENTYRRRLWEYITPYFTTRGNTEYSSTIEPLFLDI